ncbi:MAG: 1-(5-phosphoribosyl)-5-amino-4-imidazole-carboxylate carboxylase [Chloroflexi bacterium RBG_16_54_18]|nr:MAG: 1-(5-phosphoribosyl)-5-amino-4-imidazole-carboxylate carboxylase [Chloroflexi bacterium RBG_16_54_18]
MDADKIRQLLENLQKGEIDLDQALEGLRSLPYEETEFARLDTHRSLRTGLAEAVFCEHKTPQQALQILQEMWKHHERVLGTRVPEDMAAIILQGLPEASYNPTSRLLTLSRGIPPEPPAAAPFALVVSAGTADLPVAEEAAQTLEFLNDRVKRLYDVGVAGLHRLLDKRQVLFEADVIISVAGMEGALTSVVAGLVDCPVIGVPTSVGYGASFGGVAALLAMLNSCSPGVAVVNIDNGFGAAQMVHLILKRMTRTVGGKERSQPS